MYKVDIQDRRFAVEYGTDSVKIDGKPFEADLVEFRKGAFHIIRGSRSFTAEVISSDISEKSFTIKVGNSVYTIVVRDRYDDLLREMGIDGAAAKRSNELKAPMPGLVLNVMVQEGQPVAKGEPVLVLEAMKMENIIKAPADGNIRKISVLKGDKVEKNQVMIIMA